MIPAEIRNGRGFQHWVNWKPTPKQDLATRSWLEGNETWAAGRNQGGKTEWLTFLLASCIRGYIPYLKHRLGENVGIYWLVAPDRVQAEGAAQDKLFVGLTNPTYGPFFDRPEYRVDEYRGLYEFPPYGGSKLFFRSTTNVQGLVKRARRKREEGRAAMQFTGGVIRGIFFDEEMPEIVYEECCVRLLVRGYPAAGAMTAIKGSRWFYREVYRPGLEGTKPKLKTIQLFENDNPFLAKDRDEVLASRFTDPVQRAIRLKGEYHVFEGSPYFSTEGLRDLAKTVETPREVIECL